MKEKMLLLCLLFGMICCQPSGGGRYAGGGDHQGVALPLPPPDFIIDREPVDLGRRVRPRGEIYQGPLIDTHAHLLHGLKKSGVHGVLAKMAAAEVDHMMVLPTPNDGMFKDRRANVAARRQLVAASGGTVDRLCGSTYLTRWLNNAYRNGYSPEEFESRLDRLRQDIAAGGCVGIGEIGPYHFAKKPGMAVVHFPLNFQPMLAVARLAAAENIWLDLHAEPITPQGLSYEEELFGGIAMLFQQAPGLKLILSHTGMTSPVNARALLRAYPNLMMNVKIVRPGRKLSWEHLGPLVNRSGKFFEDWARLMEEMPDRFMIGSDARFGTRQYGKGRYRKNVRQLRYLLGSLNRNAAQLIAAGNARRIFGL